MGVRECWCWGPVRVQANRGAALRRGGRYTSSCICMQGDDEDIDIVDDGSGQDAETNKFDQIVGALERAWIRTGVTNPAMVIMPLAPLQGSRHDRTWPCMVPACGA